jgi:hypothetical protein
LATYKNRSSGENAMPFGRVISLVNSVNWPSCRRYTPLNFNSFFGSSSPPTKPYGGSVKYNDPSDLKTASLGELSRLPSYFPANTVSLPSFSRRTTCPLPCWQMTTRPSRSIVNPFDPTKAPFGASLLSYPEGRRYTVGWPPVGFQRKIVLPGTSLNTSEPSRSQSGPSVNWNPPASFSIFASAGMSLLISGDFRMTVPCANTDRDKGSTRPTAESCMGSILSAKTNEFPVC